MKLDLPRLRREARYLLWGWSILVCAAGTIGAIWGCIDSQNDSAS